MKLIARGLVLSAFLVLLIPQAVLATDYVSDAAAGLAHSSVYVAPGTEGTDQNTAGKLSARLAKDDNIVLVMLPAGAGADLGTTDLTAIASRLSDKLGGQRIIGLAVGNQVVGFSSSLPVDVAADQMRRANSVSNDPFTALGTFVQNIHAWQKDHPAPSSSQQDSGSGFPIVWIILLLTLALVGSAIAGGLYKSGLEESDSDQPRFKAPGPVKKLLEIIAVKRQQIDDPALSRLVYQICLDIEHYFASSSADLKSDSTTFASSLTEIDAIVSKYIEVQNNSRYYTDPNKWLTQGQESLEDFSAYVLESIKNGNESALRDYKLNGHILQAYRDVDPVDDRP